MSEHIFTESFNSVGVAFLNDSWLEILKNKKYRQRFDDINLEALMFFIENASDIKILTDTSISCITYVLTLSRYTPSGSIIISPYVSIRRNNFYAPVQTILLKVGFLSFSEENQYIPFKRGIPEEQDPYVGLIEALSKSNLEKEIIVQDTLYKISATGISSILEPICPAILTYCLSVSTDFKHYLRYQFIERKRGLTDRGLVGCKGSLYTRNDHQITDGLFSDSVENPIYFIVMEFMDGYCTLDRYIDHPRYTYFENMMKYEINRINKLGFMHGDIHPRNVLINPKYPYFTADRDDPYYGRAMIIDFGRSEMKFNISEIDDGNELHSLFSVLNERSSSVSGLFINKISLCKKKLLFRVVAKRLIELATKGLEGFLIISRSLEGLSREMGMETGTGTGTGTGTDMDMCIKNKYSVIVLYEGIIQGLVDITIEQQGLLNSQENDDRTYYKTMYQYIQDLQPRLDYFAQQIQEIHKYARAIGLSVEFNRIRVQYLLNAIGYFKMLIDDKMKIINDAFIRKRNDKPAYSSVCSRSYGMVKLNIDASRTKLQFDIENQKINDELFEKMIQNLFRNPIHLVLHKSFEFVRDYSDCDFGVGAKFGNY